MRRLLGVSMVAAVALTACVTINVYFPAAEAKEAAKVFVEKVINDAIPAPAPAPAPGGGGMAFEAPRRGFDPLMLIGIAPAYAQSQPDFNIQTPAITAIQSRMEQRFDSALRAHFDSGALGFSEDGLVVVRDAAALALKDRVPVNSAVAVPNGRARSAASSPNSGSTAPRVAGGISVVGPGNRNKPRFHPVIETPASAGVVVSGRRVPAA